MSSLFRAATFNLNGIIRSYQNNGASQSLATDQCNFDHPQNIAFVHMLEILSQIVRDCTQK